MPLTFFVVVLGEFFNATTFGEVDRMSVRELKAKLRKTRDSLEASRRLAKEKTKKSMN